MATLNQTVLCSCCGAEVTAPQFFNGKAYGWSCVLKVAGKGFKRSRDNGYWVKAENIEIRHPDKNNMRFILVATLAEGVKVGIHGMFDYGTYQEKGEFAVSYKTLIRATEDGYIRICESKKSLALKGDDRFKATEFKNLDTRDGGLYYKEKFLFNL